MPAEHEAPNSRGSVGLFRRARDSFRIGLLLAGALLASCGSEEPAARGQLMLALSTDMSIPKDVSRILVDVVVQGQSQRQYKFEYDIAPDGQFYLPGTLGIVAGKEPAEAVQVVVVGIRLVEGEVEARTLSKVVTTMPRSRVALLRLPIQWLCDASVRGTGESGYESSCAPMDGEERACLLGECVPVTVDESSLPDFAPEEVFGTPELENGGCFDTVACLEAGEDLVLDGDCAIEVADDGRELNVGLRFRKGTDGICDDARPDASCYVPLDQSERSGWREERDPEKPGRRKILVPQGACRKLQEGKFDAVRVTAACPTKTEKRATCGPWSSVESPVVPMSTGPIVEPGSGGAGGTSQGGQAGEAGEAGESGEAGEGQGGSAGRDGSGGSAGGVIAGSGGTAAGGGGGVAAGGGGGVAAGGGDGAAAGAGGTSGSGGLGGAGGSSAGGGLGGAGGSSAGGGLGGAGGSAGSGGSGGATGPTDCINGPLTFVDPNLETAVRNAAGGLTGDIMPADVTGLTSLYVYSYGITSLEGIECLTDLLVLDLGYNTVSDATPLNALTALTTLYARYNAISDLSPLSDLPSLSILDLSGNGISDLSPLSGLTGLTDLYLDTNSIGDLSPLSGIANLMTLSVTSNSVTDLAPLSGLTNLGFLWLSYNSLSDLTPLSGLTGLTSLNLESNSISNLTPLVTNSGIDSGDLVYLSGNPVDCGSQASNIATLLGRGVTVYSGCSVCVTGPLTFADFTLEGLVRSEAGVPTGNIMPADVAGITTLSMAGSGITSLQGIDCLGALDWVDLRDGTISDLTPLGFLTNLSYLNLNNNKVVNLAALSTLQSLSTVSLDNNKIVNLSPLAGNPDLGVGDTVSVLGNPVNCAAHIWDIDALRQRGVTVATDCSDCINGPLTFQNPDLEQLVRNAVGIPVGDIMPWDVGALTDLVDGGSAVVGSLNGIECLWSLTSLSLPGGSISDISPLTALTNLSVLDLSDNSISAIGPLNSLYWLSELNLSDNRVSNLTALSALYNLYSLNLDNNNVVNISHLSSLYNLHSLHLRSNFVANLGPLSNLTGLTFLDVSGNFFSDLGPLSDLYNLSSLYVGSNNIEDLNPLSGLTSISTLALNETPVTDLTPLTDLTALSLLDLTDASVTDLAPLVANPGIGFDDSINALGCPINCSSEAANIANLLGRGVIFTSDCP